MSRAEIFSLTYNKRGDFSANGAPRLFFKKKCSYPLSPFIEQAQGKLEPEVHLILGHTDKSSQVYHMGG